MYCATSAHPSPRGCAVSARVLAALAAEDAWVIAALRWYAAYRELAELSELDSVQPRRRSAPPALVEREIR